MPSQHFMNSRDPVLLPARSRPGPAPPLAGAWRGMAWPGRPYPSLARVARPFTSATRGGKGLAHNGSELHRKAVEEIRPHSMNLIKSGNDFCASESYPGVYFTHE